MTTTMMNTAKNFYGDKYDASLDTTAIAARIRADLKAAVTAGELLKGIKLSVKSKYYSMGSSISVKVVALPADFRIQTAEYLASLVERPHDHFDGERQTPAAKELIEKLEKLVNAYNFDRSDSQTDYYNKKFSDHVDFDGELLTVERNAARAAVSR